MDIVKNVALPSGLTRIAFRTPIYLYRLKLGWVFGQRLLLLNHTGRMSGKPRRTVLEVVEHDPADNSYIVASGWGAKAAWYQNILARPEVSIQVGTRTVPVLALPLSKDEGGDVFVRYAAQHRRAAQYMLPRVLGISVDGSEADFREAGEKIPFVRLAPRLD